MSATGMSEINEKAPVVFPRVITINASEQSSAVFSLSHTQSLEVVGATSSSTDAPLSTIEGSSSKANGLSPTRDNIQTFPPEDGSHPRNILTAENGSSEPGQILESDDHMPNVSSSGCVRSQMSSDQVNREINAIDSVLKALSTGGYSTTSVATLSEVAVTSQIVSSAAKRDAAQTILHSPIKPMDSACSIQSYDSRVDSTSSDSGSSTYSSDEVGHEERNGEDRNRDRPDVIVPKTKGETFYHDLPPTEQCEIPFPENGKLLPVATASHYTEKLLILRSLPNAPPVDEGTVVWSKDKASVAKVFETFGPVKKPFYSIRINSFDDLSSLGVSLGDTLYVIPADPEFTKYVFPQELMKFKGSDASWKDDNEVPLELQDYSDDEDEHQAFRNKGRYRKGKATQSKTETKRVSSRSVNRQPSVKYTNDPRMQHYFLPAHNVPNMSRPIYPQPPFSHTPQLGNPTPFPLFTQAHRPIHSYANYHVPDFNHHHHPPHHPPLHPPHHPPLHPQSRFMSPNTRF